MPHRSAPLVGLFCVLGLLILLGACRTDGPDTTTPSAETDTTMADSAMTDTTTDLKNPQPGPAPGTARVRADIAECDATTDPVHCTVEVTEVLGYGSTTPSLNTGPHTVAVAASLLRKRDASALTALGPRTIVLRHAGDQPTLGEQSDHSRPEWTLQSIE